VIISEAMSQNESEEPRAIESEGSTPVAVSERDDTGASGDEERKGHLFQSGPDSRRATKEQLAAGRRAGADMDKALRRFLRSHPDLRADVARSMVEQACDRANPRSVDAGRLVFDRTSGKPKATVEHQGNQAQIGVMVVGPGGRPIELGEVASPGSQVGTGPIQADPVRTVSASPVPQLPGSHPVTVSTGSHPPPASSGDLGARVAALEDARLAERLVSLEAGQARMLELLEKLVATRG
jgi:hypothetical protein